jgi:hypothetical protein
MRWWYDTARQAAEWDWEGGQWEPMTHLAYCVFTQDLNWAGRPDDARLWYQRLRPYLMAAFERGYES